MTVEGDQLLLDGPDTALTDELVAAVREHKPALLTALTGPQIAVADGCAAHSVTVEAVAERWAEVRRRDLAPGACACCSGPAPPQTLVCRFCAPLTPARAAELAEAPPCVRCGGKSYTCADSLAWYCEACWSASR